MDQKPNAFPPKGQKYENSLITNHQRHAYQNCNETSPRTSWNDYYQKRQQANAKYYALMVGMYIGAIAMKNSGSVLQKIKRETTNRASEIGKPHVHHSQDMEAT